MKYTKLVSKIVKEIRVSMGYSQGDFARELGISKRQIVRYESSNSKINLEFFFEMLEYFNISIYDYFDEFNELSVNRRKLSEVFLLVEQYDIRNAKKIIKTIDYFSLNKIDRFNFDVVEAFINYKINGNSEEIYIILNEQLEYKELKSAESLVSLNIMTMFMDVDQLIETHKFISRKISEKKEVHIIPSQIEVKILLNTIGYLIENKFYEKEVLEYIEALKVHLKVKSDYLTLLPYLLLHLTRYYFFTGDMENYFYNKNQSLVLAENISSQQFVDRLHQFYEELEQEMMQSDVENKEK